jgi:hypothetical protein
MERKKTVGRVIPLADKKKEGRPRKVAPPDAAEVIRNACATGATKIGVAASLGVDRAVLDRWLDESPELKEAFDQGRERERATLHNVLYECATKKNPDKDSLIASMFLLKARHQYRDQGDSEIQGNRVSINFTLPGAMKPDQFVIENEHDTASTPTHGLSTKGLTRS